MNFRNYLGGFFVMIFLVFFFAWVFIPYSTFSFSPPGEIEVIRHIPPNYLRGEEFEVTLEIRVSQEDPLIYDLLVSELVENSVISSSGGDSFYSEDLVVWGNLSFENQNLTYSLSSGSESLLFAGKWAFDENLEGMVLGDSEILARVISSEFSGSGEGSGGVYVLPEDENNSIYAGTSPVETGKGSSFLDQQEENASFHDTSSGNGKFSVLLAILISFAILLLSVIIFFVIWNRKKRDLIY